MGRAKPTHEVMQHSAWLGPTEERTQAEKDGPSQATVSVSREPSPLRGRHLSYSLRAAKRYWCVRWHRFPERSWSAPPGPPSGIWAPVHPASLTVPPGLHQKEGDTGQLGNIMLVIRVRVVPDTIPTVSSKCLPNNSEDLSFRRG